MIEALYKKHNSLRKVSKITGVPITTIWYRLNKKGIINQKTKITNACGSDLLVGTYIGLWAGDGSRYHDGSFITKIHLDKRNEKLIEFCREVIKRIFQKDVRLYNDSIPGNQASLKIHSEFIYNFPLNHLIFNRKKSESVRLKNAENAKFIQGFLLGLTLTDGYLKDKFVLSTISSGLAEQVIDILIKKGFSPKIYTHQRDKYGWKDLKLVRLSKYESEKLKEEFNETLKRLNYHASFDELKYKYEKEWPRRDIRREQSIARMDRPKRSGFSNHAITKNNTKEDKKMAPP